MERKKWKWNGTTVEGEIYSTHVHANGKQYFVKLTKPVDEKFMSKSRDHDWPIVGSVILAEEAK